MVYSLTRILSIFGQIESTVAHSMAAEGKIALINAYNIPHSAPRFNQVGERAACAVILTPTNVREFNSRVRCLRELGEMVFCVD